jgi:hypothetical protein
VQNDIPTAISKLTTSNSVTEEGKDHISDNEDDLANQLRKQSQAK